MSMGKGGGEKIALGIVVALVGLFMVGLVVVVSLVVALMDGEAETTQCRPVASSEGSDGIPEQWRDDVEAAARVSGAPVSVHAAMTDKESGWDESAVNTASGAAGMAQAMPATWEQYGQGDPMNGADALAFQGVYMAELMELAAAAGLDGEEQLKGALAAYNWGPGNMEGVGWDWTQGPAETTDYVTVILGNAQVSYSETCEAVVVGAGEEWDGDLGDGEWTHPLPNSTITGAGAYGPRNIPGYPAWANMHAGIDFATPDGGGTVIAPMDFRVTAIFPLDGCVMGKATTGPAFGVELCHMEGIGVEVNDELKRGDVVGEEGGVAGSLGGRTVEHLHYAMYDPSGPDPQYPGHQNPVIDPTPILIEKGVL